MANRDGVKLYDWNKLTDRRSGYAWYTTKPAETLATFKRWSRQIRESHEAVIHERIVASFSAQCSAGVSAASASPLGAWACRTAGAQRVARADSGADGISCRRSSLASCRRRFPIATSTSRATARAPAALPTAPTAIRAAIDACSAAGGGRVVVPAGRFLTGPIHLKSNVNLHVARGATLAFSQDPTHYLPAVLTRFEGTELMNYSPFIYAFEQENIADHRRRHARRPGRTTTHWWPWKGSAEFGWKTGAPNYNAARQRLFDDGGARRAGRAARVRRGRLPAAELHPAVPLQERAHRRRDDHQLADVGDPSGALPRTSRCAA